MILDHGQAMRQNSLAPSGFIKTFFKLLFYSHPKKFERRENRKNSNRKLKEIKVLDSL